DAIEQYEPIVEVETDKVTSEVTAVTGGTLLKIYVGEGQTVDAGTVLAMIGEPGEAVPDAVESEVVAALGHAARGSEMAPAAAPSPALEPAPPRAPTAHVTPVVARIAAEHHIDVSRIQGTGHGGRVTKKDILAYIDSQQAEADLPPWERPGS